MKQVDQFQDKPLKPLTKKILVAVACVMAILILVPVVLLTAIAEGCDSKLNKLNEKSADINKRLAQTGKFGPEPGVAYVSGDCTTAGGVSMNLERIGPHNGAYNVISQINDELGSAGLPKHINAIDKPDRLYVNTYKKENGNHELTRIDIDYSVQNGGSYEYIVYPAEKIECTYAPDAGFICEGIPQDKKVQEILTTKQVSRVELQGFYSNSP